MQSVTGRLPFVLGAFCFMSLASGVILYSDIERIESNCVTLNDGNSTSARASIRSQLGWTIYELDCHLTVAHSPHSSAISCAGNTSIKAFLGPGSGNPVIHCECNEYNIIDVEFEFLESEGSPVYEDTLLHPRHQPGDTTSWRSWDERKTITIKPVGRVSTRYIVKIPVTNYHSGTDLDREDYFHYILILVLYGPREPKNVKIYGSNTGIFIAYEDIVVVPCLTGLSQNVSLYETRNWTEKHISWAPSPGRSFTYDPMEGVSLNLSEAEGYSDSLYNCCPPDFVIQLNEPYVLECEQFSVQDPPDLDVNPVMRSAEDSMHLFLGSRFETIPVALECNYWEPVKLVGTLEILKREYYGPEVTTLSNVTCDNGQSRTNPRVRYYASFMDDLPVESKLEVECRHALTDEVIYAWNITTHDMDFWTPTQNMLNIGAREINTATHDGTEKTRALECCSGLHNDTRLRAIKCENEQHCNLLQWCFNSEQCGDLVIEGRQVLVNNDSEFKMLKFCAVLPIPTPGVFMQCTAGEFEYRQQKWLGLSGSPMYTMDSKKHDFDRVMYSEAIRTVIEGPSIDEDIYYTRIPYNITCIIQPYCVARVAIRFIISSVGEDVGPGNQTKAYAVNVVDPKWAIGEKVQTKFPSSSVIKVQCLAKVPGLENYITDTRGVRVVDSIDSRITNDEITYEILHGEKRAINCLTSGLPPPTINWTLSRTNGEVTDISANAESDDVHVANRSVLHFNMFTKKLVGIYTCTADNGANVVSKNFLVSLKVPGISAWTVVGVATTVSVLVLAMMGLLVRYFFLKGRRVLDRIELQEFMRGTSASEEAHYMPLVFPTGEPHQSTEDDASINEGGQNLSSGASPRGWAAELVRKPFDPKFNVNRKQIKLDKNRRLGAGEYGNVFAGSAQLKRDGVTVTVDVAIKMPKKNCPAEILSGLLKEVKIIASLSHENIVCLVGANVSQAEYGKLYVLMEWCEEGSLEQFLERNRRWYSNLLRAPAHKGTPNFGFQELIRWCQETATGLEYLASKSIVHRDIAARNVLLTKSWTAKVSDFGLSRQLYGSPAYEMKSFDMMMPCRWMAPECFEGIFSVRSDVWAFAIFSWELFSLGQVPYTHIDILDVCQFADQLCGGLRITPEERYHATPAIFEKLEECWNHDPGKRPSFTELRQFFVGVSHESLETPEAERLTPRTRDSAANVITSS